jgi:hypothetical protein
VPLLTLALDLKTAAALLIVPLVASNVAQSFEDRGGRRIASHARNEISARPRARSPCESRSCHAGTTLTLRAGFLT